jgi:hypothetical protein
MVFVAARVNLGAKGSPCARSRSPTPAVGNRHAVKLAVHAAAEGGQRGVPGRAIAGGNRGRHRGMTHPGKLQVRLMSCPSLVGQEIQPRAHLDPLAGPRATTDCSDQHCPDVGRHSISAVGVPAVARQQVNSPPVSTKAVAISSTFVTATHSLTLTRRAVAVSQSNPDRYVSKAAPVE